MAKKETSTAEFTPAPKSDILMPELDEVFQHSQEIVTPNLEVLHKQYLDALQFNEEPIAIRVEPSSEENPPLYYDCWVNGKGCELWDSQLRRWIPTGAFPVGKIVITRRKYVEALAFAKRINVRTAILNPQAERPENRIHRTVSQRAVFSVMEDRNPKGRAWIASLIGSAA